jgi:uncharacterized membrane protein
LCKAVGPFLPGKIADMTTALQIALIIHIVCGFIALVTGFISMLTAKGGKRHRSTGKIFFYAMTGVFLTATFISIGKNLAFLFMVGFFSYYLACAGYRRLYLKKLHLQQKPKWIDWVISLIGILAGLALVVFSIAWFRDRGAWGIVPLSFGSFCFLNGFQDLSSFFYPPKNKQHWIVSHGVRMGASFAATCTAFTVVNLSIGPAYNWILWVLPGVLIGIWISRTIKAYLRPKMKNAEIA